MNAGREMDALVAEKVMGWIGPAMWMEDEDGRDPYLFAPDTDIVHVAERNRGHDCIVPRYSTDIAVAWVVVEKLRAAGFGTAVADTPDGYEVTFDHMESGTCHIRAEVTLPLAVCRAALVAVGAEVSA